MSTSSRATQNFQGTINILNFNLSQTADAATGQIDLAFADFTIVTTWRGGYV